MGEAQDSRVGTMFGPYHLTRLLGRGGMGEVYEAEHTVKEWTVAVKLMSENFSRDPVFRERMKREARITGRLQEPHVVPIHEYGEIDGTMFMEMHLIEGIDLDSMLKRFGPLTPARAVAIISQVASALDAAHAAGVMHRDVKPPNVLVTHDDFAYLCDFGIASATTDEKLTQLGTAVGTWKYMAPERFSDGEVTYRADIYALACVLHECLTGAAPYRADSVGVLVTAHVMEPIPQPSTAREGIPKAFDAVIARGMAKKPEDRYVSAGDLALAAHEALSDRDQDSAANILRRSQDATLPGYEETTPHLLGLTEQVAGMGQQAVVDNRRTPTSAPQHQQPGSAQGGSGPSQADRPILPSGQPGWGPPGGPIAPSSQHPGGGWDRQPPGAQTPQPFQSWTPGPQPPGPPKRNPWPIIAAVAAAVVLVVAGTIAVVVFTGGDDVPGNKPTTPSPKPTIATARLEGLLLTGPEISNVMNVSGLRAESLQTEFNTSSAPLSIPECEGAVNLAQQSVYQPLGAITVSERDYMDPVASNQDHRHMAKEAVVNFPTPETAQKFMQTSADRWKTCANQTVQESVANQDPAFWSFGHVDGNPPKITITKFQGNSSWSCQRALAVANNVIADITVCDVNLSDQGSRIADQIVAKINTQS